MQGLQKIILLNCASFAYAAVDLTKDRHILGENGSGKTSFLRTILFFYQTHTRQLGIRNDQKNFVEFYFRQANSYLLYEVRGLKSFFLVWVYVKKGKICYRFLDTRYRKEIFLAGDETKTYSQILKKLKEEQVHVSDEIDKPQVFKQVIFGVHSLRKWRKFAVLQPNKEINKRSISHIAKSLTNIFLSSKLEADYFKTALVQTILGEEYKVNLSKIREEVSTFYQDWQQIDSLEKKESSIKSTIDAYREVVQIEQEIKVNFQELQQYLQSLEKEIEQKEKEYDFFKNQIEEKQNRFQKQHENFESQKETIIRKMGLQDANLDRIEYYKKLYTPEKIAALKEKVQQKKSTEQELLFHQRELISLQTAQNPEEQHYHHQLQWLENDHQTFLNQIDSKKFRYQAQAQVEIQQISEQFFQKKQNWQNEYVENLQARYNHLRELESQLHNLHIQSENIEKEDTHEEEVTKLRKKINQMRGEIQISETNRVLNEKEITTIEEIFVLKSKATRRELEREQRKFEERDHDLTIQINQVKEKIKQYKGSLIAFLDEKYPDWKSTIGKFLKDDLLWLKNLNPQLEEGETKIFGLTIDLKQVSFSVKTLEDFKKELKHLQTQRQRHRQNFEMTQLKFQNDLKKLAHSLEKQTKDLKKQGEELKEQASKATLTSRRMTLEIDRLKEKSFVKKDEAKDAILTDITNLSEEIDSQLYTLATQQEEWNRALVKLEEEKSQIIQHIQVSQERVVLNLEQEREEYERQYQSKLQELALKRSQKTETTPIEEVKQKIQIAQEKLEEIEKQEEDFWHYQMVKKEFWDKKSEFEQNVEYLQKQRAFVEKSYQNLLENQNNIRQVDERELEELHGMVHHLRQELEFDWARLKEKPWMQDLQNTLGTSEDELELSGNSVQFYANHLENLWQDLQKKEAEMQTQTREVWDIFAQRADFPQKTYPKESSTLRQFISKTLYPYWVEKGLENHRRKLGEKHQEILDRVAKASLNLLNRGNLVQETIDKLNREWEQNNFIKSIKKLSLNFQASKSPLIQVLKEIHKYQQEADFSGQLNLYNRPSEISQSKRKEQAFQLLQNLHQALKQSSHKFLEIQDTFEIQLRVLEENNDTDWAANIQHIGSEGIDVLVKAFIFMTLLDFYRHKSFKNSDLQLHCPVDDIGRISYQYLAQLKAFAQTRNIYLIGASPNPIPQNLSDKVYKITKEEGKSVIKEIGGNPKIKAMPQLAFKTKAPH